MSLVCAIEEPTIGQARAWLPSRRSVANQRGLFVILLDGHVLSGRSGGSNASYLSEGLRSLRYSVLMYGQWGRGTGYRIFTHVHRHGDQQFRRLLLSFTLLAGHTVYNLNRMLTFPSSLKRPMKPKFRHHILLLS